ncbi:unnamed protein product [Rotaria sp. Silwood1]|nr:unnamed protein product [Rotaria sp. Silwood1]CAF1687354.1 unnamed protein product [Rotaria sp. Silwood1]CAF5075198.1 unnamed protein product [Rotaria sp. Silwood1]
MTTNLSKGDILKELDEAIKTDSNVKISTTISQSLEYLDVTIDNNDGHLKISIYHKSASELYILPYESDHPRHVHANLIYTALLRAARNCSNVEDFHMGRLSTEMILLVKGCPPKFIQHHIKEFFVKYVSMSVWTELNSEVYQQLHNMLLYRPTKRDNKTQISSLGQLIRKTKNEKL